MDIFNAEKMLKIWYKYVTIIFWKKIEVHWRHGKTEQHIIRRKGSRIATEITGYSEATLQNLIPFIAG